MRIYLSGTIADPLLREDNLPTILRGLGLRVVSQWHLAGARESAQGNYEDICSADGVLAVVMKGHRHQGLHAEVGYALGRGKRVFLLGDAGDVNLMLRHPAVTFISNIYDTGFISWATRYRG